MSNVATRTLRRVGLSALALVVLPLGIAELATRALTRALPENGMEAFVGVPLVPYRPEPAQVRAWIERTARSSYVAPDPELGWSIVPNGRTLEGRYEANAQGARARRDVVYAAEPPAGMHRLVAIGDSFTHGDGVANDETWEAQLAALRGDLEVVNLGVPGYGTDQAVLRWRRDGASLRADVVLLGIWPENICRNLNVVRYFLQPASGFSTKPRFVAEASGVAPIGQPVLAGEALVDAVTDPFATPLVANDYWMIARDVTARPWQHLRVARVVETLWSLYQRRTLRDRLYAGDDPSGIAITVGIAQLFGREVAATGASPQIVLIPMRELLERYPDENSFPLARALRAAGIEPIDLGPPMARTVRERGADCCFEADGHLTPEGNQLVARWLAERLGPQLERAGRS
jgi:lysophospholipase L1-like esterase